MNSCSKRLFTLSSALRRSYYDVLGINRSASKLDIEKAFYEQSKKYDPKYVGTRIGAAARFRDINTAYETLRDTVKRHKYDTQMFGRTQRPGDQESSFSDFAEHGQRDTFDKDTKAARDAEKRFEERCTGSAGMSGKTQQNERDFPILESSGLTADYLQVFIKVYLGILGCVIFYQMYCGAFKNDPKEVRGKIDYLKREAVVPNVKPVNASEELDTEWSSNSWGTFEPRTDEFKENSDQRD